MPDLQKRRRSKNACGTCRELKRKCDGGRPCGTCSRLEYDCSYPETVRQRRRQSRQPESTTAASPPRPAAPAIHSEEVPELQRSHHHHLSVEANSAAAFVQRLALRMDPSTAPGMRLFAWNAFLGARGAAEAPASKPLTDLISQTDMRALAAVYFDKLDPVYGVIDRHDVEQLIKDKWSSTASTAIGASQDAILYGIAAIGCLFSHVRAMSVETHLVESAKAILEGNLSESPAVASVTAWLLRVIYLRVAGTPHMAWMASNLLMHMVEAAGLHCEPSKESVLPLSKGDVDAEVRRRLFGVSQHLNIWMSFDLGCSRVTLRNATSMLPSPRPGNFTVELLGLLPYSQILDPERTPTAEELESTLLEVLSRVHSIAPSVLAQCNLMLCICRRLKSLNVSFTGTIHDQILAMISRGAQAAQEILDLRAPWHHMANVPFQMVCILLAIDTLASTSRLKEVMGCLSNVVKIYNTEATQEALRTASLLVLSHKRRKEKCVSNLDEVLRLYPVTQAPDSQTDSRLQSSADVTWLDSLTADIPGLQELDVDQFLSLGFPWDTSNP
ncbi:hypothetical protein GQ53DRAFT_794111 [Thozetella sp. PMI_491]|nr:hypothetical protein GQ53DRAFT_794111 [Thozetella sp. PMI_491]